MSARNPPAFPRPHSNDETPLTGLHQGNCINFSDAQDGMTLRDYFAAHALTALATNGANTTMAAEESYYFADAMLKAREQEPTP